MKLPPAIFMLQSTTPQAAEPSPDWALTILGLVFAAMVCALAALVGLVAWGLTKASGPRRKRGHGGTWVAVPNDDLWIHFSDAEDAGDRRHPRAHGAPRSRPGPYRADLWDEP